MSGNSGKTNAIRASVAGVTLSLAIACTPIYRDHGYVPLEEDLTAVQVGKDTRQSVLDKLGEPSTGGLLEGGDYFYVRSKMRTIGPRRPEVIERQVVAIVFDKRDRVANVERYGLQDGNIVPLSRRVTSSSTANKGFLRQLLGNLGRLSAEQLFGS